MQRINVLLVDDSAGDIRLTKEAFRGSKSIRLRVVSDGVDALAFLQRTPPYSDAPQPDFILLDLNMPRLDGRELLAILKQDPAFWSIPVVVLTSSEAEADVHASYRLGANAVLRKPFQLEDFEVLMKSLDDFWFRRVTLPPRDPGDDLTHST